MDDLKKILNKITSDKKTWQKSRSVHKRFSLGKIL